MTERYVTDGGSDRGQSEQSHRFAYDVGRDELPSEAVVKTVAAVTNTSPLDLDPLHDVIDPDTLNRALDRPGTAGAELELSFTFEGCAVTATPDEVRIADAETGD